MKFHPPDPQKPDAQRQPQSAFALISVLLILVVLTVGATVFLESMRVERIASRSFLNFTRAQWAAEAGLADAIVKLSSNIDSFHYVSGSQPLQNGQLITYIAPKKKASEEVAKVILLKSENSTAGSGVKEAVIKLNPESTDPQEIITQEADYISITGPSDLQKAGQGDVEVARYAYWGDEANSKQNLFVARQQGRTNTASLAELPLFTPSEEPLTKEQMASLNKIRTPVPTKPERTLLLSARTINQAVPDLNPPGNDYHYALSSPAAYLTPEGYPKLDLVLLKKYVDDLPLRQGPNSARAELVDQLLDAKASSLNNPWGAGSLEFLKRKYNKDYLSKNFPTLGMTPQQVQRQIVANLLDYIDADFIPTTDGSPDPAPTARNDSPNQNNTIPARPTTLAGKPTFMGVEARVRSENGIPKVQMHPYISYIAFGMIYNMGKRGGVDSLNSTRLLISTMVNNPAEMKSENWYDRYEMEVQLDVKGKVNGGPEKDLSGDIYSRGWLSQFSRDSPVKEVPPYSTHYFPTLGVMEYANGQYTINRNGPPILSELYRRIEYARLIYKNTDGQRYIVQDLSQLNEWLEVGFPTPPPPPPGLRSISRIYKISAGVPAKEDYYLEGDPRLNFLPSQWSRGPGTYTGGNHAKPVSPHNVFKNMSKMEGDGIQDATTEYNWSTQTPIAAHFPTYADGYRPSPAWKESKEDAYSIFYSPGEIGFIHAGLPWQSLRLHPGGLGDAAEKEDRDWNLLAYIKTGNLRESGKLDQSTSGLGWRSNPVIDGQVNVNTVKDLALRSALGDIPHLTELPTAEGALNEIIKTLRKTKGKPYTHPAQIYGNVSVNQNRDIDRDAFARNSVNALTAQSQVFTFYVVGEAVQTSSSNSSKSKTLARVTLKADVQLIEDPKTKKVRPTVIRKSIL